MRGWMAVFVTMMAAVPVFGQTAEGWANPLKTAMKAGKPVVGMTVTVPSADVAVTAAAAGFDFLWIEMEHSGITLESARNIILATRGTPTVPLIRVPVNEYWTAKRALDIGALGVIFPFTSTPELARQAVDACKYPPVGKRGAAAGLATLRWPVPGGYADFADNNVMVIIIIEQKEAVERIDEILAVPGIDVVFIGPNDLSYSYGDRGRQTPRVEAAIAKVVEAAKKRGIPAGRTGSAGALPGLIKQGFVFFQGPSELSLLRGGADPLIKAAGKTAPDPASRPLY